MGNIVEIIRRIFKSQVSQALLISRWNIYLTNQQTDYLYYGLFLGNLILFVICKDREQTVDYDHFLWLVALFSIAGAEIVSRALRDLASIGFCVSFGISHSFPFLCAPEILPFRHNAVTLRSDSSHILAASCTSIYSIEDSLSVDVICTYYII